jgi:cellulose 1,4-beta-cellobiosidase
MKKNVVWAVVFLALSIGLVACGENDGSSVPALSAPINVSATPGNRQVALSWNGVSGVTQYMVYRSTSPSVAPTSTNRILSFSTPNPTPTYHNRWLNNGTTYYYVVTASTATGESVASQEVSGSPSLSHNSPATPTGVTVVAGAGQVTINCDAVSGSTLYRIYTSTSAGQMTYYDALQDHPYHESSSRTNRVVSGLDSGITYYFTVTAGSLDGESEPSLEVSATPT